MRLNVLLQQPVFAHYREPVFRELADDPSLNVTYAYGQPHPSFSLQTFGPSVDGLQTVGLENRYFKEGKLATVQKGLTGLVKREPWDVVVLGFDPRNLSTIQALRHAKKRKYGVVLWGKIADPSGKYRKVYDWLINQADAVLLYNEPTRQELIRMGYPADKLFAAWNSIDTVTIQSLADPSFSVTERMSILHLGRLVPAKNVGLLAEGYARAVQKGLVSDLVLMGDGPQKAELQTRIDELGISDRAVIVSGVYDEESTATYFNKAWCSVSPGEIGLNIVHSFAYGVPMLIARGEKHSSEISVAQEGVNSIFFPGKDPDALADALISAHANFDRLRQMGQAGQEYVLANFSVKSMVGNIKKAIVYAAQASGRAASSE